MKRYVRLASLAALASASAAGAQAQTPPLVFKVVPPCRIADTRPGQGGTGALAANETRTFHVVGSLSDFAGQGGLAGGCAIPGYAGSVPQVQAVVFNFVAVSATGAGDLRAWPTDGVLPNASILNYAKVSDQTSGAPLNLANGIVIPVSQDAVEGNDLSIRADVSGTHVVVDVVGYFAPIDRGELVTSLNGQTDDVTLSGTNGLSVSATGGTVTVTSNATASNTAGAIVSRDGSGNFAAGTVTASLAGNAATATTAVSFSGSLAGEVTGTQGATAVSNAVSANTANAIVRRNGSGSFSAGTVTLAGALALPSTAAASAGVITVGGNRFLHTFGTNNTFAGNLAGNTTLTGNSITAFGASALSANTSANFNSAFGYNALLSSTTGGSNSAFGGGTLVVNTTGIYNSAFGANALLSNNGSANAAFGGLALQFNDAGGSNSAFGYNALGTLATGGSNTAIGSSALGFVNVGTNNVAIGASAGQALATGSGNIYIGNDGMAFESNFLRIGSSQTATFVAGIFGQTSASGVAVLVNNLGKLGTILSSRRYKQEIADLDRESDVLMKLRPVAFYYRPEHDDTHTRQYGLVAEEVAAVAPQLVVFDQEGQPQTVRYHFVNAMILNEVQKQRRTGEEQRQVMERQEQELNELRARLSRMERLLQRQ
jgi:Chaperone of endosialidase